MRAAKVGVPTAAKTAPQRPIEGPRFLLDTAAIVEAANFTPSQCITTPEVTAEVRPGGATHRRLEQLLAAGLEVRASTNASLERAQATARKAGNYARLSAADLSILALGIDVGDGGLLVSDDYTVLDLAKRLGLRTQTLRQKGIEETQDWAARCGGCNRSYPANLAGAPCPVCGSEIRLRPKDGP